MDASARAELEGLRRRAYGRAPDIQRDHDALLRLIELEEAVVAERGRLVATRRPSSPDTEPPGRDIASAGPPPTESREDGLVDSPPPDAVTAQPDPEPAPLGPFPDPRLPFRVFAASVALAVGCGLAALAIPALLPDDAPPATHAVATSTDRASSEAYSFAQDPDAVVHLNVPLGGSFADYIDLPADGHIPAFPARTKLEWASPLGEYFGWDVWIAGSTGATGSGQGEHCLLIERGPLSRGRCVPAVLRPQSALLVAVPYTLVTVDERPVGMRAGERLGFWWSHQRAITVMVGDDPER
ncbi:hypothetical protein [Microbacterium sp. CFBP9034]|uniref:hypothetical protein n=1 Tax=Microbacterium sp. CFBP9034 TaxID=3096540 RepID=UPI002A6A9A4F|nr:hypothetical protein [Microbacterium sp. CFBP9034]MDY0908350.1 hypothetical protein [Microbacterium sp. CFBP9034]